MRLIHRTLFVLLVLLIYAILYFTFVRPWLLDWGCPNIDDDDVVTNVGRQSRRLSRCASTNLPGDELVNQSTLSMMTNRAISIDAPRNEIYPWLAQMGAVRGGMYSFEFLERLLGSDTRNSVELKAKWQQPQAGITDFELHPLVPRAFVPSTVFHEVSPPSHVVIGVERDRKSNLPLEPHKGALSWAYVLLNESSPNRTTLLVRYRADSMLMPWWQALVMEPVSFMMERKQLLGIKRRAERTLFHEELDDRLQVLSWLWTAAMVALSLMQCLVRDAQTPWTTFARSFVHLILATLQLACFMLMQPQFVFNWLLCIPLSLEILYF
jgi:hypothetical protein